MQVQDFLEICDSLFPFNRALEGDKVGLQIINSTKNVEKVLVCLEISQDVVEEARLLQVDTIISFHPLIYKGFDLAKDGRVENLVRQSVILDLNIIVIHTNFDTYEFGTNFLLAKQLGLNIVNYFLPENKVSGTENVNPQFGMGLICAPLQSSYRDVSSQDKESDLTYWIEKISNTVFSPVKYTRGMSGKVSNILLVCGSGSSFLDEVFKYNSRACANEKIDTFITADVTYHTFHTCKGYLNLIDIGHYEMEQFVASAIFERFKEYFSDDKHKSSLNNGIKFYKSKVLTNPVDYYPSGNSSINFKENQINYLLNQ